MLDTHLIIIHTFTKNHQTLFCKSIQRLRNDMISYSSGSYSSDDDDNNIDEIDHNDAIHTKDNSETIIGHSRLTPFCHQRVASHPPSNHTEDKKNSAYALPSTSKRLFYSIIPESTISNPSAYESSRTLPESPLNNDDDDDGNAMKHTMKETPTVSIRKVTPLTQVLDDASTVMELIPLDTPDSDSVSIATELSRRMSLVTFETNTSALRIPVDQESSTDDLSAHMMDDDDITEVIDNRVRPFNDDYRTAIDLVGTIIGVSTGTDLHM